VAWMLGKSVLSSLTWSVMRRELQAYMKGEGGIERRRVYDMPGKIELCPVKRFSWSVSSSERLICSCLCLYGRGGSKNETQWQRGGGGGSRHQGHPKKSNYVSTRLTNQIHFGFRVGKLLFVTKICLMCSGRHKLDRIGTSMLLNWSETWFQDFLPLMMKV